MSSFTTYNNIIARFELFANNHLQIKRFSQGNISVADLEKDGDYPVLHVVPGTFAADQQYQYGVDVYVFDKPRDKDEFSKSDYQREVISDCAQILNDVIADMTNGGNVFLYDEGWQVELPVSITPFIQEQQHVVTGVQASLNINLPWGLDACELPLIPITPAPPVVCLDATVEINGVELNTIASGGTLDITVEYENGTPVGTLSGGDTVTIPNPIPPTCDDAEITVNGVVYGDAPSGGTFNVEVEYDGADVGSLVLSKWAIPIVEVTNSDATFTDDISSAEVIAGQFVAPDITVTNQSNVTSSYPAIKNIDIRNYRSGILYSRIGYKYDQFTSYYAGDAGANLQAGRYAYTFPRFPTNVARLSDTINAGRPLVLADNSVLGNTTRINAEGANTSIDEMTGLQWYNGPIYTGTSWQDCLDRLTSVINAGAGTEGYTDWRMPTVEEFNDIMNNETTTPSYVIPGFLSTHIMWTSNSNPNSPALNAFRISTFYVVASAAKSSTNTRLVLVRTKRT